MIKSGQKSLSLIVMIHVKQCPCVRGWMLWKLMAASPALLLEVIGPAMK